MPRHCDNDREARCGAGRRLASAGVISLSSVALDTGDADEFTFSGTGDFARYGGISPCEQATATVAS